MIFRSTLLLVVLTAPILAQEPQVTPDTRVDTATLDNWLHSGNPRLIAWAADFARRRHDGKILADIPPLLQHWSMPPLAGGYEEQAAQRRAVLALLDCIIQENVKAPLPVIEAIAQEFPAQAVLLIQRIPLKSSQSTLMDWTFQHDAPISGGRSQAAAMILAATPDSDFVYHVLGGLVQHVTIRIIPRGSGFGYGSGSTSCGDSFGLPPTPGWPVVYTYHLEQRDGSSRNESSNTIPIVKIGNRKMEALRYEENRGWGECTTPQSDASFRHELVAYWLGIEPEKMTWQPDQTFDVVWTTRSAYEREVGAQIEEDRVKMSRTLQQLLNRRLIDEKMIDGSFPQISIRIECDVTPCPLADIPGR